MTGYVFYFDRPEPSRLSCCQLAAIIGQRLRKGAPQRRTPRDGQPATLAPGDPADLTRQHYMMAAASLQWALTSDRVISPEEAQAIIDDIRDEGRLPDLAEAIRKLMGALLVLVPSTSRLSLSALAQIAALGYNTHHTLLNDHAVLEWIEKELQAVDLASMLGL